MQTLEHFHREAVKNNLSAGAILLWHQLYFTMDGKNQFADLPLNTAVLTAQLKVSRQGLALMRQALADNGLLAVRVDKHQQTFYTLMLNGKAVGDGTTVTGTGNPSPTDTHTSCVAGADAHIRPLTEGLTERASGDIILTNRIRPYIDQFCDRFGPAMKGDLIQWAEMRRKNGWTLTLWGLEALFKKLIDLSGGIGAQMAQIVAQSVTRRWKGFFALKVKAKPSGEALRKQEESNQPRPKPWDKPAAWQKCKPEGRDLSFLEI